MASSIIHRGTGMAMYFGTLLIVLWLGAAALGDGPMSIVNAVYGFWLVQAVFFLATRGLAAHVPERGRPRVIANLQQAPDELKTLIKVNDWNQLHLISVE